MPSYQSRRRGIASKRTSNRERSMVRFGRRMLPSDVRSSNLSFRPPTVKEQRQRRLVKAAPVRGNFVPTARLDLSNIRDARNAPPPSFVQNVAWAAQRGRQAVGRAFGGVAFDPKTRSAQVLPAFNRSLAEIRGQRPKPNKITLKKTSSRSSYGRR